MCFRWWSAMLQSNGEEISKLHDLLLYRRVTEKFLVNYVTSHSSAYLLIFLDSILKVIHCILVQVTIINHHYKYFPFIQYHFHRVFKIQTKAPRWIQSVIIYSLSIALQSSSNGSPLFCSGFQHLQSLYCASILKSSCFFSSKSLCTFMKHLSL